MCSFHSEPEAYSILGNNSYSVSVKILRSVDHAHRGSDTVLTLFQEELLAHPLGGIVRPPLMISPHDDLPHLV
jgi:hypothetical protein